jgi:ornithine cyclodeaminase
MDAAILGMKEAYRQLSAGEATLPMRSRIEMTDESEVALFMPAAMRGNSANPSGALAIKVVSVFRENPTRGLPLIHGLVLVLEAASGRPLALMEGGTLTAIRTGAGSGAATDLLARPDAATVTIFGCGVQARTQLQAVCTVRTIKRGWVYNRTPTKAEVFVAEMRGQGTIPSDLLVAASPKQALDGADIVCTATTSVSPVFNGGDLKPGTHINAVGAFTPEMQEVDTDTIRRALVFVDSRESVLAEAGDLIAPIRAGVVGTDHIHAELGEIVAGVKLGRTTPEQITYFKSCGVAVQDVAAAQIALAESERLGLGTMVSL